MPITEYTEPNVCIGENLTTDDAGQLRLQPWAVPRLVADVRAMAADGDRKIYPNITQPGKLLINQKLYWRNDTPLPATVLMRITRGPRYWLTSNPNAIQFKDNWTYARDAEPSVPLTTSIAGGLSGSAIDIGTNSVAEPNPGQQWMWTDINTHDEWVPYDIEPNQQFAMWYRCYVWTPPPWSDNANKNSPKHEAAANWARLSLIAFGQQGSVVTG